MNDTNMNEKQQNIYEAEVERMKTEHISLPPFWKPKPGKYKVRFLGEAKFRQALIKDEVIDFADMEVVVGDTKHVWSVKRSVKTDKAVWTQLVKKAVENGCKLDNLHADIVIIGEGKERSYTIV